MLHQFAESIQSQRLGSIAYGFLRLGVNFDDEPVGAHGNRCPAIARAVFVSFRARTGYSLVATFFSLAALVAVICQAAISIC